MGYALQFRQSIWMSGGEYFFSLPFQMSFQRVNQKKLIVLWNLIASKESMIIFHCVGAGYVLSLRAFQEMIAFLKAKEGELLSLKVIYKKRYETTQYFYDSTQYCVVTYLFYLCTTHRKTLSCAILGGKLKLDTSEDHNNIICNKYLR